MQTIEAALKLLKRQAQLETAMKQRGGIRVIEERELHLVRRQLADFPEASSAVVEAAHALQTSISDLLASQVELWAGAERAA
jgi:hypothetical protein